jgi:hypothetical protein
VRRRVSHAAPSVPLPRPRRLPPGHSTPRPRLMMRFPRDPRANPPRAAPQTPVAVPPTHWPDPRPRSPPATLACVGCRAPPLNSPPWALRHSPLAPVHVPPIKTQPVSLPARTPLRRPPLPPPRCARPSTLSHRQTKQLGTSPRTQGSFHGRLFTRISPESEPRWELCHSLATAARRQPLRPNRRRPSNPSEPNHSSMPLVHLLRPPFANGELTPPPEGIFVKADGMVVNPGT